MGQLKIISERNEYFVNRVEAGIKLNRYFQGTGLDKPVVIGIPRGGCLPAWELAIGVRGEMDFMLCQKLIVNNDSNVTVGAIAENGNLILEDQALISAVHPDAIEQERKLQATRMTARCKTYRAILPKLPLKNRTVLITDDGVATGLSMEAVIGSVKREKPSNIILAVPVAERGSIERIAELVDETVCLCSVAAIKGISEYYLDFNAVSEREVLEIFKAESLKREASGGAADHKVV